MRLIDADALIKYCSRMAQDDWNKNATPISWAHVYGDFIVDINNAQTVEAVQVVICKDCKHARAYPWHCNRTLQEVDAYDYCSWAERIDGK